MAGEQHLPREIKYLVVHCSATRCNVPFPVESLRACHCQRGFRDIGYHFYITRDGALHHCRPMGEVGAHVAGFNLHSIGVCYEGGLNADGRPADTRTAEQCERLREVLSMLHQLYSGAKIVGHRDLCGGKKACPCFDATREYSPIMI